MHSLQRRTLMPSGNANSTGQRGPLKSVILKLNADYITYMPAELGIKYFVWYISLTICSCKLSFKPFWSGTSLDAVWAQKCMSQFCMVLQYLGKKIYNWAHFWSKKFNGIKLPGLSKNLFRRKCWLQPKPEKSADNILKMSIHHPWATCCVHGCCSKAMARKKITKRKTNK